MMDSPRVLVVDDDPDVLLALGLALKRGGYECGTESDPGRIDELLGKDRYDAVMLDMNFSKGATDGREGLDALARVMRIDPDIAVVALSAYGDVDIAVAAIKAGASDFVLKPWNEEKLLSCLGLALRLRASEVELGRLRSRRRQLEGDLDARFGEMIAGSPAMAEILGLIGKVAATEASVLITGENGTGKELVARAIHRQSARGSGSFVGVDIASLPATLFESELFGHVRGAFTDAKDGRAGRFEFASGGTLFLDEIGNLPLAQQAKLLRALESREVVPVGSNRGRPVNARLICASNLPLGEMADRGEFRRDLLYRINTIEIDLPPLRERREDIGPLAERFAEHYAKKYRSRPKRIPARTMRVLESYRWPGNIRELKHAVERAVIVSEGEWLEPSDFPPLRAPAKDACPSRDSGFAEGLTLGQLERSAVEASLKRNGGNLSRAAAELGLSRAGLYRRIEKHGLSKLPD